MSPYEPDTAHLSRQTDRRPLGVAGRVGVALLAVVAFLGLLAVSAVAWAAHAVVTSPSVRVAVTEHRGGADGERVSFDVAIPAAVVSAGLIAAPWVVPDEEWEGVRADLAELDEVSPQLRPVLAELARELGRMPDATLVEVRDGAEQVRVEKVGGELRIAVRSPQADVDVDIPLTLLARAARFVEG